LSEKNTKEAAMAKRRRKKLKPKIVKVVVPPKGIVKVKVPAGHMPLVLPDLRTNTVEIVPVKKPKPTWWEKLFDLEPIG
jgi:hypothetical protein